MSLETTLVTLLTGHAGLGALIAGRLYPLALPQTPTLPAVVYSRISTRRIYSQSGFSNLSRPRFQFDCWAATYLGLLALVAQLIAALESLAGDGISVAFVENEIDMPEPLSQSYRRTVDAFIWYGE